MGPDLTEDQRRRIEDLFARYSEGVGSFVLARVGDAELAEEITSRVFLKVVRRFPQCRRSPAGWLWSIVRTELAQYFRRRPRSENCDPKIADGCLAPDAQAQQHEDQLRLQAALGELPDKHQRILYMKFYQDMPNIEIAEATGLTPSHVGVLVHRCLKRLRALMGATRATTPTG
jgi:RNA polymerase sigma-70 factor (ECF subfamily)